MRFMSDAHAVKFPAAPHAAVSCGHNSTPRNKGIISTGNIAVDNGRAVRTHQPRALQSIRSSNRSQKPGRARAALVDSVARSVAAPANLGESAAAMADIRTMLIDLDDCLYQIEARLDSNSVQK